MHRLLAQALNILDIKGIQLLNENREKITSKEHAQALFTYLDMAGYLNPDLFEKAVSYLSLAKPFAGDNDELIRHLKSVYEMSHKDNEFNVDYFLENFSKFPGLAVDDVIDLVVFLQQTAFDRKFGVERDKLKSKPWLELHKDEFAKLAKNLGVTTPLLPTQSEYFGTAIMGASSYRVIERIEHFNSLKIPCGIVLASSGNRLLSQGLDDPILMEEVANAAGKSINYIKQGTGDAERLVLEGVTETMMVNYLIEQRCKKDKIEVIDSAVEKEHWRATTSSGVKDIAQLIIQKIQDNLKMDEKIKYNFMVIAEQPYGGRMARQAQRAFNEEIQKRNLSSSIEVFVEPVGLEINETGLSNILILTRVNSELAAVMAERFNDARLHLKKGNHNNLRDPNIIMFAKRDEVYSQLKLQHEEEQNTVSLTATC